MSPNESYGSLMWTIRTRFDAIDALKQSDADPFSRAESAAFHGRKIVEAIAFGCLVAVENSLKEIPRDARGQWSAEAILKSLQAKGLTSALPSPSEIRRSTEQEQAESAAKITIQGVPERRLSHDELIAIYQRLHSWLHEVNPYVHQGHAEFYAERSQQLWGDLARLHSFMQRHFISIRGEGFFCVLKDTQDSSTKVIPLSKLAA